MGNEHTNLHLNSADKIFVKTIEGTTSILIVEYSYWDIKKKMKIACWLYHIIFQRAGQNVLLFFSQDYNILLADEGQ